MSVSGTSFDNGQFWVNQNTFSEPGDLVDWHAHQIPHTTMVRFGHFKIFLKYPDGKEESYEVGPYDNALTIPAKAAHRVECVKAPGRTECLFLHRKPRFGEDVNHDDPNTWEITDRFHGLQAAYR